MFAIPARSPDLNPIENIFHLIRKELRKEALDFRITQETYAQFCKRVAKKIRSFPVDTINKTIGMYDQIPTVKAVCWPCVMVVYS